jgi:hypothetical protein
MKQAKKAKGLPIAATTQFSHLTFALTKARKLFLFFKSPLFYKGYFTGFRANFTIGGKK